MSRNNSRAMQTGMFAAILGTLATLALANGLKYTEARTVEQVDTYHGVKVVG